MKQSKKNILSVLLLSFALLISGMSFAQAPRGGQKQKPPVPNEKQVKKMVTELSEELELSDEQEEQVLEVYQEHFKEVKEKTSGEKRPDREDMDAMKTSFEIKIKALLSNEQQIKFEDYMDKHKQNKPKRK